MRRFGYPLVLIALWLVAELSLRQEMSRAFPDAGAGLLLLAMSLCCAGMANACGPGGRSGFGGSGG